MRAKLRNHEFLFGAGAFDILAYLNVEDEGAKEKLLPRVRRWEDLFNYSTLPFYWGRYEPEEGKISKDGITKAVEHMRGLRAAVNGHPLCWHIVCADWLLKYPLEEIMKHQLDCIAREVGDFKGKIE